MKEAPKRFRLVEDSEPTKVKPVEDPVIKQRRERLIWAIVAIVIFVMLANGTGTTHSGDFDRERAQQMKELADDQKEFWIEWHKTFGGEAPTP